MTLLQYRLRRVARCRAALHDARARLAALRQQARQWRAAVAIVQRIVAAHYSVSLSVFSSPCRRAELVLPRHVAMALCYKPAGVGRREIARAFGRRNTSTIHKALCEIADRFETDPRFAAEYLGLKAKVILARSTPAPR